MKKIKRRCKCNCGSITNPGNKYINGHNTRQRNKTMIFGRDYKPISNHRLYTIWKNMNARCYYKNSINYKYYGGRGIRICIRWKKSFISFYKWAIKNSWKEGLEIDRDNNNGNYTPDNCRFVNATKNRCNQRIRRDNKTGYIGITIRKDESKSKNRYRSSIGGNNQKCIGYFNTPQKAAIARNNYIKENNLPNKLNTIS